MSATMKKAAAAILAAVLALSGTLLAAHALRRAVASDPPYEVNRPTDLFTTGEGVTVTGNYRAAKNEIGNFNEPRSGVLFTTTTKGARVNFKYALSNVFALDYRLLSAGSLRDVDQISFFFEDCLSDRSFELRISCRNTAGNYYAKVYIDGSEEGWGCATDDASPGSVSSGGQTGITAFSGKEQTQTNLSPTADQPAGPHTAGQLASQILFNPDTMEIRVNSDGSRNALKLVMDLDSPTHMEKVGEVFPRFTRYRVSVGFTAFLPKDADTSGQSEPAGSASRPGKLLLYSLNGQSLGGEAMTDNAGPTLSMPFYKGVAGKAYDLTTILAYDVKEGPLAFDAAKYTLKDEDGNAVTIAENGTFTPPAPGKYFLSRTDASGHSNETDFTYYLPDAGGNSFYFMRIEEILTQQLRKFDNPCVIEVAAEAEPMAFSGYETLEDRLDHFQNRMLPLGETLSVPPATAASSMQMCSDYHGWQVGTDACAVEAGVVFKGPAGDETVGKAENIITPLSVKLDKVGAYEAVYTGRDASGNTGTLRLAFTVSDEVPLFTLPEIPEKLARGSEFVFAAATAAVKGTALPVKTRVTRPDGTVFDGPAKATLDQLGAYTVTYSTEYRGTAYTEVRTVASCTDAQGLFENVRASEITVDQTAPSWAEAGNGVLVTATRSNAEVRYKNVINLNNAKQSDILLQFLMLPESRGDFDFSRLRVKLTDAYDASNYVEICIRRNNSPGYRYTSFISAGTNGNPLRGLVNGQIREFNQQTTVCPSGFYGYGYAVGDTLDAGTPAILGAIHYDNGTRGVYVTKGREGTARELVLDLDNTAHVGAGNEWEGFATGEVYLTLTAEDLAGSTASYLITKINGQSMAGAFISPEVGTEIVLDTAGHSEDRLPLGEAGKPYPVFEGYAYNQVDGRIPCGVQCFYGAGESAQVAIENGRFVPERVGTYRLVYRLSGAQRELTVQVVDKLEALSFAFPEDALTKQCYVGEFVSIPREYAASGGSGNLSVKFSVSYGGSAVELVNNRFFARAGGVFTVTALLTDYLGTTATFDFEVAASYSNDPVWGAEPAIPAAALSGKRIVFPDFSALTYFADKTLGADVSVRVRDRYGKERVLGRSRAFTPDFGESEFFTVIYRAASPEDPRCYVERAYGVVVLDPYIASRKIDKAAYFYSPQQLQIAKDDDSITFSAEEGFVLTYVNPLPALRFRMIFQIPQAVSAFETLSVLLTDSGDASVQVRLEIHKNSATNSALYVNGRGKKNVVAGSFGGDTRYDLWYDDGLRSLVNGQGKIVAEIAETLSGDAFTGFPSGTAYLTVTAEGARGTAGIRLMELCDQVFNGFTSDLMPPEIQVFGEFPREPEIGSLLTVPRASAVDILDPETTLFVSVRAPDKTYLVRNAPADRDLSVRLTQYGRYTVTYTARDSSGNASSKQQTVTVNDLIPPELSFAGEMPVRGVAGQPIVLPAATVTDNNDAAPGLYVHYVGPNGHMAEITGNAFTPKIPGKYTVRYFAKDASYSYVLKVFEITVEGE